MKISPVLAVLLMVASAALLALGPLVLPPFYVRVGQLMLYSAGLAVAWTILGGFAGYASFGHAAFIGVGAFAAGLVEARFSGVAPPMLLLHGLQDQTVRPKNSRNLATALRALGVPVTLRLYPKLVHGDTVAALSLLARGRAPTLADIEAFVRQPRLEDHDQAALAAAGTASS